LYWTFCPTIMNLRFRFFFSILCFSRNARLHFCIARFEWVNIVLPMCDHCAWICVELSRFHLSLPSHYTSNTRSKSPWK
jgi:hypothetical protein